MSAERGPLLTVAVHRSLLAARRAGAASADCSLDLERSNSTVALRADGWIWNDRLFPFLEHCRDRTIYYWTGCAFEPAARYAASLIKLVPTQWGAPTFEIDGIKMLPSARISPYADAERKVALVAPRGKLILDTCGGLGYFAAWCLRGQAAHVYSYEVNPDVVWLRGLNPWSPAPGEALTLVTADVAECIVALPAESVDAVLHDPPRFGIAGQLYSQTFYHQLARVLRRRGRLFHYTGTPNKLSRGRDLADEVALRLRQAGFTTERNGDGILALKSGQPQPR